MENITIDKKLMTFTYLLCGIVKGRREFFGSEINNYINITSRRIKESFGEVIAQTPLEDPITTITNHLNCYEFDGVCIDCTYGDGDYCIKLSKELLERFKNPLPEDSQYEYIKLLVDGFTTQKEIDSYYVGEIYKYSFIPVDRNFFTRQNNLERSVYIKYANECLDSEYLNSKLNSVEDYLPEGLPSPQ